MGSSEVFGTFDPITLLETASYSNWLNCNPHRVDVLYAKLQPKSNITLLKVGAAQLLQAQPEQRVPEGAAAAQGAQDRRDLDQEELPDQRGAEDLSEVVCTAIFRLISYHLVKSNRKIG